MNDQTPPPPPPTAPGPAPFTPPDASAPPAPQQGGYFLAPPPPTRRKLTPGAIVAIVVGSLIVLGGIVVGMIAVTSLLADAIRDSSAAPTDDPDDNDAGAGSTDDLVTGDEASPFAVEPMDCGGCFREIHLGSTIVDADELDAVGLISTIEPFTDNIAHYDSEATYFKNAWNDADGDPDECFVTFPQAPISILEPGAVADDGSIISYTGVFADEDEWSTLGQSVRLFEDDQDAVDYMSGLPALIAGCTRYTSGSGNEYWRADVTPAPALDLPPSVAGIGWVERAEYDSRYYSFDLQRGNLVVRTALFTGHEISELEFRALVEHVAVQLAEITPD